MEKSDHKCSTFHLRECEAFDASHILGAPFPVTLHAGVYEKLCDVCGASSGHILKEPQQLVALVAVLRACHEIKLNGSEVKFLRKCMSLKSKTLAEKLALDPATLSRIENDKQPISEVYEKLLRAAVCLHFMECAHMLGVDVKGILSMNISAARCVSKVIHLDVTLVEQKVNLHDINSGNVHDKVVSASWRDDPDPRIAM